MPEPDSESVVGEFVELLLTVTVPVTSPVTEGANVTFKVTVRAGSSINPADRPSTLKPEPAKPTPAILTVEFPTLENVAVRAALLPTLTFPNFKLVGLPLSKSVAEPGSNVGNGQSIGSTSGMRMGH